MELQPLFLIKSMYYYSPVVIDHTQRQNPFAEAIYKRDRPGTMIFNMNVVFGATVSHERL